MNGTEEYRDFYRLLDSVSVKGQAHDILINMVQNFMEEVSTMLEHSGQVDGVDYTIKSAGHDCGNTCAIVINGIDYSLNSRGMNIVVYSGDEIEPVCFDTFAWVMAVTRRL